MWKIPKDIYPRYVENDTLRYIQDIQKTALRYISKRYAEIYIIQSEDSEDGEDRIEFCVCIYICFYIFIFFLLK